MATKSKTKTVARSSKTGRFVSKAYAKTHKSTTEIERRPKPKK